MAGARQGGGDGAGAGAGQQRQEHAAQRAQGAGAARRARLAHRSAAARTLPELASTLHECLRYLS